VLWSVFFHEEAGVLSGGGFLLPFALSRGGPLPSYGLSCLVRVFFVYSWVLNVAHGVFLVSLFNVNPFTIITQVTERFRDTSVSLGVCR
jgi:hypothetical protein